MDRALDCVRQRFARRGVTTSSAVLAAVLADAPVVAAPATLAGSIVTATTAAAAVGSAGTIVIGFMSTVKLASITAAVSVAGVAVLGTALYTWSDQQQLTRTQLAATDAQMSAFRVRLRDQAQNASRRAVAAQTATRSAAPAATGQSRDAFVEEGLRFTKILESSPEFAVLHRQEILLRAEAAFGPFLASRNYSPEQTRAIREALVAMYLAQEEEWNAFARAPVGSRTKPDVATIERVQKIVARLRPLLSEDDITQLQRGFSAHTWLKPAQDVGADLADAGVPMPRMHELALAVVMADAYTARKDLTRRPQAVAVDSATGLTVSDRTQLDDAAAFLTPEQLKVFERYLRDEHERDALSKRASGQTS